MEGFLPHLHERIDSLSSDVRTLLIAVKGDSTVGAGGILPRLDAIERQLGTANLSKTADDVRALQAEVKALRDAQETQARASSFTAGKSAGISLAVSIIVALVAAWISAGHH